MRRPRLTTLVAFGAAGLLGATTTPAPAQQWLAFRGTLGYEWLSGPLSKALEGAPRSEWTIILQPFPSFSVGPIHLKPRVGGGLSRITYEVTTHFRNTLPPDSTHWNHVRGHAMVGAQVFTSTWIDVYVEYRRVWGHLRSQNFVKDGWDYEHPDKNALPYYEWSAKGTELVAGIQTDLAGTLPFHLDLLFRRGDISPRGAPEFDLSLHGLGRYSGGTASGFQIGVYWHP